MERELPSKDKAILVKPLPGWLCVCNINWKSEKVNLRCIKNRLLSRNRVVISFLLKETILLQYYINF